MAALLVSILVLVAAVSVCAQVSAMNAAAPEKGKTTADPISSEGYSSVLYNNTNGLPTSEANDIAQTSEGFLWIGSYSGLVRYDGNTFERMDSSSGITSVKCLYADSRDRLWIGTNDNGLALMEQGELRWWGRQQGLKSTSIRSVVEDKDGLIYVATTRGLAMIDQEGKLRNLEDPRFLDPFLHDLRVTADGMICGVTNSGDLIVLKNGRLVNYINHEKSSVHGISCLFPDPEKPGYYYYETKDSEVCYGTLDNDFEDRQVLNVSPLTYMQRFEYVGGRIWVCARNGIGVLLNGKFHILRNAPMNNSVGHVMEDYEGNLWFTSTRQGVMKIVPNRFMDVLSRYGLPEMVVNSTCLYDGKLFMASDTGLAVLDKNGVVDEIPLTRIQTASGAPMEMEEPVETDNLVRLLDGCRIRSIIRDSRGRLWISTWRKYGLLRLDHGELTAFTVKDGLFSDQVRAVCERKDGSILVAVTGGVCVIEGDSVTKRYGENAGIVNTETLTVSEGTDGDILLGSDGGGIYIISDRGVRHVGSDEGLTSENVMRIKRDPERGLYWIVTGNSIAVMTEDYKVTNLNNFPYSNNFDLYENSRGEMWVLSSNGIYVVRTEELIANGEMQTLYYGISNGLPCITTANSYSELTEDGTLYIAGTTSVARVNIEEPYTDTGELKMAIPWMDADGIRIYPDEEGNFTIGSNVRKLTIYAYVFNYSLLNPQVTYRLEGFDKTSVTVSRSDLGPVNYTNLRGGTYRFVLQVRDPMEEGDSGVSVKITKAKALYEQPWFYLGLGLATLLCLAGIVRLYLVKKIRVLEKKHQEQAEKDRISNELHTAGLIQSSMLPQTFPPYPDRTEFDIYATMTPAKEVGGDFYDFFLIDDDHLCLVIADVSGKGIPASLFMMISKVIVQSCAMLGKSAGEILTKTNEALCSNNQIEMFVTVWLGILEISTGRLTAANAGHEYPAVKDPDGKFALLKDKHGLVIGGMDGIQYKEYELQLEPGTKLFVYTDGVPEATDAGNQMFGTDRMLEALNEEPDASPEQLLRNVHSAVNTFVRGAEQFDDLTMLCMQYKGTAGQE